MRCFRLQGGQVGISPESRHRVADWRKKVQLENKKREIHSARREIHSVGREINSVGQLGRKKNTQHLPLKHLMKIIKKHTRKEEDKLINFNFYVVNVLKYMIALEQVATLSI